MTFAELFSIFQNNVFPGMLSYLADNLGVKESSLNMLGIGFNPVLQAWVFPERDSKGEIVGLKYRFPDGKKTYEKSSKSGLTYPFNADSVSDKHRYDPGMYHWVRIADVGITCPVCGKPDWCRVSPDDPHNPSAVLCARIKDNCTRTISDNNYLHVLDPKRNKAITGRSNVLQDTDRPILVVEGATDVLAALDMGLVAIGRPSAQGGLQQIRNMPLAGKEVWIIGENDAGAGKEGMVKCYVTLKDIVKDLVTVMPPTGVKDLRDWYRHGLTAEGLADYVKQHGNTGIGLDPDVFEDDVAFKIAERLIDDAYVQDGIPTLRSYKNSWYKYDSHSYDELEDTILKGSIYRFLNGKKYVRASADGPIITPYKPTASKIRDIIDSLSAWCPVAGDPPVWLKERPDRPQPVNLMAFHNGLLDVRAYLNGDIVLYDADPTLFSLCAFPYDFDPDSSSKLWDDFLEQIFNGDRACIEHLQEWFGYVCVPDMSMEKMMLFTGRPRSGKSTVLDAMTAMLGPRQCVSTDFQSLASQFGRYPLVGKLAAVLGDAKTPRASEADAALETMLRIIGRDPIFINPKHKQGFDSYLTVRFTVAMNGLPTFTDHAKALVARTNVLSFPNSYVGKEDFTLKDRLRKEAEQGKLIAFALEGLRRLKQRGYFNLPDVSKDTLKQMTEITSPMVQFVDECCAIDTTTNTESRMMFEAWQHWCAENGHRPGMNSIFGRNLLAECPTVAKNRMRQSGQTPYVYQGIGLQSWVFDRYLGRPQ